MECEAINASSQYKHTATLYLSPHVICGKVPGHTMSPWQIPLLFYSEASGKGGNAQKQEVWYVCVWVCVSVYFCVYGCESEESCYPACLSGGWSMEIYLHKRAVEKNWIRKVISHYQIKVFKLQSFVSLLLWVPNVPTDTMRTCLVCSSLSRRYCRNTTQTWSGQL